MREICTTCEAETGRAGRGEDSLYAGDFGPYCEDCWDELRDVLAAEIERLTAALETARAVKARDAARVLLDNIPNPVFDTLKPALMGEHSVSFPEFDSDGNECFRDINVPWIVQKAIIRDAMRALAKGGDA